jgi:hypothetical protein
MCTFIQLRPKQTRPTILKDITRVAEVASVSPDDMLITLYAPVATGSHQPFGAQETRLAGDG